MEIKIAAFAKVNWALYVRGVRADGYHELQMLTQSVALCDHLELTPADSLELIEEKRPVCADSDNLILRAARALCDFTGENRGARIRLFKNIPVRAGLGGGSADCAAALRGLNALWGLGLSDETLLQIGARLGADVPFCLGSGLARVEGIGERVTRLPKAAREIPLVVLHTPPGLQTSEVFLSWDKTETPAAARDFEGLEAALLRCDLSGARARAFNALMRPAMRLLPDIGRDIAALWAHGASFAAMSGSGSAVFGAFDKAETACIAAAALGNRAILTKTLP